MVLAISGARLSRLLAIATPLLPAFCLAQSPVFTAQSLGGETPSVNGINDAGDSVGTANEGIYPCPSGCATVWTGKVLETIYPEAFGSVGYGINNASQVVGYAFTSASMTYPLKAVIWNDSKPSVLPLPGPQYTSASAISVNASGQVVGTADVGNTASGSVAVVWNGSTPTVLDLLPGYTSGYASAISDSGLIVGYMCCDDDMEPKAVVWHGAIPALLPTLAPSQAAGSKAVAVNNSGVVVGQANTTVQATHAVAWSQGVVTDLGTLGGSHSFAKAVNNRGIIVGYSETVSGQPHATVWASIGAPPQDLNSLLTSTASERFILTEATGINDSCSIVGNGVVRGTTNETVAVVLRLTDTSLCVNGLEGKSP
jgi:probable HAF family extracellular repeat protein